MTILESSKTPAMRGALGVFAIAAGVAVWTLVGAFRGDAEPSVPPVTLARLEPIARGSVDTTADISAAIENDLFSADRSAPTAPYRMPGEVGADNAPKVEAAKPVVLGTAVATDGRHFATVQLGTGHPTLVHVGDKIGEWVVRTIERGKIALVSAGGTRIDVTVPKPGT